MFTGCLDIADGKPVTIGTFFKPRNLGAVFVAALLVALGTLVGSMLCIVPGLIFGFLAQFTVQFVVDRSLSPVESIKASIAITGPTSAPRCCRGSCSTRRCWSANCCAGSGVIAALPVAVLLQIYTYRKLSGGQVVPLEQPGYQPGPPPVGPPPGQQFA